MFQFDEFYRSSRRYEMLRKDAVHMLKSLPPRSVHSFISDPPYGIELKLGTSDHSRAIAGDGKLEARQLWSKCVPLMHDAAKEKSAHLFFGTWKSPWMHDVLAEQFDVKGCIVWDKKIIGLGHYLRPRWELIFLCVKGRPPRRGTAPADIWEQARHVRTLHPCQKPVELMRRAVRLITRRRQLVCDPFAGIASTGIAALLEGRRFLGCEIDPRYARMATSRLAQVVL